MPWILAAVSHCSGSRFVLILAKPGFLLSVIILQISCAGISIRGASLFEASLGSVIARGSAKTVWTLLLAARTVPRQSSMTPRCGFCGSSRCLCFCQMEE